MSAAAASYYVYMIRDHDGTITFEAVRTKQADDRLKGLYRDYVEACKAWKQAAKEAKSAGTEFDDPKPKKPGMVKAYSKRICGKEQADSIASIFQEKWEEKQEKKRQKELDELEDDPPKKTEEGGEGAKADDGKQEGKS